MRQNRRHFRQRMRPSRHFTVRREPLLFRLVANDPDRLRGHNERSAARPVRVRATSP